MAPAVYRAGKVKTLTHTQLQTCLVPRGSRLSVCKEKSRFAAQHLLNVTSSVLLMLQDLVVSDGASVHREDGGGL